MGVTQLVEPRRPFENAEPVGVAGVLLAPKSIEAAQKHLPSFADDSNSFVDGVLGQVRQGQREKLLAPATAATPRVEQSARERLLKRRLACTNEASPLRRSNRPPTRNA